MKSITWDLFLDSFISGCANNPKGKMSKNICQMENDCGAHRASIFLLDLFPVATKIPFAFLGCLWIERCAYRSPGRDEPMVWLFVVVKDRGKLI